LHNRTTFALAQEQRRALLRYHVAFRISFEASMKKTTIFAGAALLALFAVGAIAVDAHHQSKEKTMTTMPKAVNDLMKIDQTIGDGKEAVPPVEVTVHYTGWLYDPSKPDGHGDKFDSSLDRGEPFSFYLGGGQVIRGWDEGVAGMKIGGKRTLIIPSHMGYGTRGAGGVIPPNATLVFDVELLGLR
jgi:FKBP-type peptidyl-prolyl cis-trans isomerase FkpA